MLLLFTGLPAAYFILPTGYVSTIIALSFIDIVFFLLLFGVGYAISAFRLSFNEWVYDVEDMNFWFNPSFMTWLFAKHRERWAKWITAFSLIGSLLWGIPLMILFLGGYRKKCFF